MPLPKAKATSKPAANSKVKTVTVKERQSPKVTETQEARFSSDDENNEPDDMDDLQSVTLSDTTSVDSDTSDTSLTEFRANGGLSMMDDPSRPSNAP